MEPRRTPITSATLPIIGGGSIGYNEISFVAPGFGQPAATFAQGLPYTQAQMYPTTLNAGIVPFPGQLNSPAVLDRSERWPAAAHQSMEYWFAAPVHAELHAGGRLCRQSGRLAAGQQPGRRERSDAADSGRTRPEPFEFRESVASVIDFCVGEAPSRRFQAFHMRASRWGPRWRRPFVRSRSSPT